MVNQPIYELADVLAEIHLTTARWEVPFGRACDSIEASYRKKLAIYLGNAVGIALLNKKNEEENLCAEFLSNCSEDIIQDLLDSPAVAAKCYWERNNYSHNEIAAYLKNSILLLSKEANSTGWTPSGDRYFKNGVAEYIAPRIENIIIDTMSPCRLEGSGNGRGNQFPAEPLDIQVEASRLIRAAIELLDKYCPIAAVFVRRQLCVIVPRTAESAGSSSTISYPGRAILDFPKRGLTVGEVAEALVHESLHTLLYKLEAFYYWVDDDYGWARKIVSPWTGNELSLHAYSHACFVWYALAGLWFQLQEVNESTVGVQPSFRMWDTVKGFLNDAVQHIEHEEALLSEIRQKCYNLQADIFQWYS